MDSQSNQEKNAKNQLNKAYEDLMAGQGNLDALLQNSGLGDLIVQTIQGIANGTVGFNPQVADRLAANAASQATGAFQNNVNELATRYAGQGSGTRSGAFAGALGNASSDLARQIAEGNRQAQVAAALQQIPDIGSALQLGTGFSGLENQFLQQIANLNAGGANTLASITAPSPKQAVGGGFGSLLGTLGGAALGNEGLFSNKAAP